MFKILHLLVASFIFLVIFSFSHVLYLFDKEIVADFFGRWGYEWIKSWITTVYWILFWIWLSIYLFRYKIYIEGRHILKRIWIIFAFIFVCSLFSTNLVWSFIWLSEKYHWFLFFTSLLLFFTSIYFWYEEEDYKKIINYIFIITVPVYIYALIQWAWNDPLLALYESWKTITRTTSFFGNPNFLAGYILMLLPLSNFLTNNIVKYSFLITSIFVLFSTGSYLWIFLWIVYVLYFLYNFDKKIFLTFFISGIIWLAFVVNSLTAEKIWTLTIKPHIATSTLKTIISSPKAILVWYWADTMQEIYDKENSSELSKYETSSYLLDRSYNLFVDFIFFFWIFGWLLISFFIIKSLFITTSNDIRLSILLFIIFFSFNIVISIHYILLLLILAWVYNKSLK